MCITNMYLHLWEALVYIMPFSNFRITHKLVIYLHLWIEWTEKTERKLLNDFPLLYSLLQEIVVLQNELNEKSSAKNG